MSFFKKKLNAILPGEGARGALQNVLTVEWGERGQHKTVLVEVPQAGPSRSNEVEMYGMGSGQGRDYGNYGKLSDEDDEDERRPLHSASGGWHSQSRSVSAPVVPPRDPDLAPASLSRLGTGPPPLAPRPQQRRKSTNPFDRDNIASYYASAHQESESLDTQRPSRSVSANFAPNPPPREWQTYPGRSDSPRHGHSQSGSGRRQFDNPWEGRRWEDVDMGVGGIQSPGSSRGTRDSAGTNASAVENPFR